MYAIGECAKCGRPTQPALTVFEFEKSDISDRHFFTCVGCGKEKVGDKPKLSYDTIEQANKSIHANC